MIVSAIILSMSLIVIIEIHLLICTDGRPEARPLPELACLILPVVDPAILALVELEIIIGTVPAVFHWSHLTVLKQPDPIGQIVRDLLDPIESGSFTISRRSSSAQHTTSLLLYHTMCGNTICKIYKDNCR